MNQKRFSEDYHLISRFTQIPQFCSTGAVQEFRVYVFCEIWGAEIKTNIYRIRFIYLLVLIRFRP